MLYNHKNGMSLRKVEESDLAILKDLKDESWFGTHGIAILDMEAEKRWFDWLSKSTTNMVFSVHRCGVFVGVYKAMNIDWINQTYDSAHDVLRDSRVKGLSKRVLECGVDFGMEVLNMRRLNTEVLSNNHASFRSAQFVGFVSEGLRREAVYRCGERIDSIVMGLLRSEWLNLERVKEYAGICNTSYKPMNGL